MIGCRLYSDIGHSGDEPQAMDKFRGVASDGRIKEGSLGDN